MQFSTQRATASLQSIPSGVAGTRETLRYMSNQVRAAVRDPAVRVRSQALDIVAGLPSKDWRAEIEAVYYWVRENIRFVKDIRGVETLQTPARTLQLGQGDCDDQAVLIAALLEAIGHPTRFHAIGFSPGNFAHVYAETRFKNRWTSLETTEPMAGIGWQPPGVSAHMIHVN